MRGSLTMPMAAVPPGTGSPEPEPPEPPEPPSSSLPPQALSARAAVTARASRECRLRCIADPLRRERCSF
ncbi:hypothetical protein DQ240_14875 [Blastococcus sp. TF02A-26]|nr:hypothetical protein DQ240_14875 [Blastococcus sp. TF02A-26]